MEISAKLQALPPRGFPFGFPQTCSAFLCSSSRSLQQGSNPRHFHGSEQLFFLQKQAPCLPLLQNRPCIICAT